jgi:ribosomal protein L40E
MGRVRDLLAHGGVALLAIVFALALAAFNLAASIAREVVSVIQQRTIDEDGYGGTLSFRIRETEISYGEVLYYAIALALVAAGLLAIWLVTRGQTRVCQECGSRVPVDASICRFCTSELGQAPIDG